MTFPTEDEIITRSRFLDKDWTYYVCFDTHYTLDEAENLKSQILAEHEIVESIRKLDFASEDFSILRNLLNDSKHFKLYIDQLMHKLYELQKILEGKK